MKLGKWNSRKLFSVVAASILGYFVPALVPLLVKLVPTYVGFQGVVDAVKAWKEKASA